MARILSIDYGTKRVGLAATDPLQIIANPLIGISNEELETFLKKYLVDEDVERVIIGLPLHADGKPTKLENAIKKLKRWIEQRYPSILVDLVDEAYSTVRAKEIILNSGLKKLKRRDKKIKDKISAVLILQEYLGHI